MKDTVLIRRDSQGFRDDTFNPTTGAYDPPSGDTGTVYSGPGMVWCKSTTLLREMREFGGQEYLVVPYGMILPIAFHDLMPYDIVTVTASADPDLLTKTLFAIASTANTYGVVREYSLEERTSELYPG